MLRSSAVGHGSGPRPLVLDGSKGTHKSIIMIPKEKAMVIVNLINEGLYFIISLIILYTLFIY